VDEHRQTWMNEGACRNYPAAAFFPSDGVGVDAARSICAGCTVTDACLEYALVNRIDHGVWGGASERQRRRILRGRRQAAKGAAVSEAVAGAVSS
jgi:WhiB family redox-sensing transcriptional regulator